MAFNGKVIAVTGGAQGIGLATSKLLASRGASLSIADSNPATLAQVEEDFKAKSWPVYTSSVDIRDAEKVNEWIEATVERFGRLDGAVNAAGTVGKYHGQKPIAELEDEDWHLVLGVNVTGMMHCLRAELRHIQDGGSIVNIASNQGSRGAPGCAPYATSKHAVIGLTRCAAHDYGSRQIRVNVVAPGGTHGPLMKSVVGDKPPPPVSVLGKYAQPEEVASMITWLLGPESTHTSGEIFRVDGGEFA
ncbi:uncharacterized protein E0L32_003003 [Thyridium curvatum]|uniref:Uncharacterized protein n=1 Tax=Thyridium curvatum TaxID=1093900 RepID=A0A507B6J3_9PEZI|nr:uncharacterized protein E0L32_003003 [Thyridium curvatum]TPX17902.1 hypothetical protein E0L32_003003 [Thyridium curvatum]